MKNTNGWILLYFLILLGDVIGIAAGIDYLHVFCKPLLMPALLWGLFSYKKSIDATPWPLLAAGLFFSWVGDILFLYEARNQYFFIGGLCSFLIAHVCYILYFYKCGAAFIGAWGKYKLWMVIATAYSLGLVLLLFPKLGSLLMPVIAYSAILTIMLISSIAAIPVVAKSASLLFVTGAITFVISDSALAINKFYQSFPLAGVVIMVTYGIAQFLITKGAVENKQQPVS